MAYPYISDKTTLTTKCIPLLESFPANVREEVEKAYEVPTQLGYEFVMTPELAAALNAIQPIQSLQVRLASGNFDKPPCESGSDYTKNGNTASSQNITRCKNQ